MSKYYKKKSIVNGYKIIKILGEGRYGRAYLGVNDKGQKVVIKQLKEKANKENESKLFYEEDTLKKLDNSNFPKFIDTFKNENKRGYIIEYIEGKTFSKLVYSERYEFSKAQIYEVCDKLLDILDILYKNNIVHRDIRLPNVIQKENKEIALIDFGLARYIDNDDYTQDIDFWYLGDFLLHLYYTTYNDDNDIDRPWYEELDLTTEEIVFLKKLLGIEDTYENIEKIREDLNKLKNDN